MHQLGLGLLHQLLGYENLSKITDFSAMFVVVVVDVGIGVTRFFKTLPNYFDSKSRNGRFFFVFDIACEKKTWPVKLRCKISGPYSGSRNKDAAPIDIEKIKLCCRPGCRRRSLRRRRRRRRRRRHQRRHLRICQKKSSSLSSSSLCLSRCKQV